MMSKYEHRPMTVDDHDAVDLYDDDHHDYGIASDSVHPESSKHSNSDSANGGSKDSDVVSPERDDAKLKYMGIHGRSAHDDTVHTTNAPKGHKQDVGIEHVNEGMVEYQPLEIEPTIKEPKVIPAEPQTVFVATDTDHVNSAPLDQSVGSKKEERSRKRAKKRQKRMEMRERRERERGGSDSGSSSSSPGGGYYHKAMIGVKAEGKGMNMAQDIAQDMTQDKYSAASVLPIVAPQIVESKAKDNGVPYDKYSFYTMVLILILNAGAVAYCICIKPAQRLNYLRARTLYADGSLGGASPKKVDSMTDSDGDIDDATEDEDEEV